MWDPSPPASDESRTPLDAASDGIFLDAEPDLEESAAPEVVLAPCRRCRKLIDVTASACLHCGAGQSRPHMARDVRPPESGISEDVRRWKTLLVGYAATLIAMILCDLVLTNSPIVDLEGDRAMLTVTTIIEVADSIIVLTTWLLLRGQVSMPRPRVPQVVVWMVSLVALAAALGVNYGYHAVLIALGVPVMDIKPQDPAYWPWYLAAICVQPAVVEELFFRGCAWKVLRPAMSMHATVLVSSVMFGMAHIGVPLSIPVLMLVGVMLGYARAYSGSIWLPVLLHFLHNLVVTLW